MFVTWGNCIGNCWRSLLTVLALWPVLAHATSGLNHSYRTPHYASEVLQLDVTDLQVQALGSPIRMLRTWKSGQWVWNERWANLQILGPADPAAPLGATDPANADRPYAILRDGKAYLRSSSTTQNGDVYFNNLPQRTLIALQHGLGGYRWQDINGSRLPMATHLVCLPAIHSIIMSLQPLISPNGLLATSGFCTSYWVTIQMHF